MAKKLKRGGSRWAAELARVIHPMMEPLYDAVNRASHLVTIYKEQYGTGGGRRKVYKADLLRAAVVFLHAAFEEYLRELATIYYPSAGESALNDIPLAGLQCKARAEKFYLGKLTIHRGKSVDDVILESVAVHLRRSNFNDIGEVVALLSDLSVPVSDKMKCTFPHLQQLIQRRHQIVHKADRIETKGKGKQRAASISVNQVQTWIAAIREFARELLVHVIDRELESKLPVLEARLIEVLKERGVIVRPDGSLLKLLKKTLLGKG